MFTQQYPSYPYRPSTDLDYTDAIGTSKDDYYTGLGSVFGRWNPIPIGVYADMIIRQMGATTKDIEAHLRNVIGREVEKDIPFIFIPNANAPGQSGGYFYDKQTGQIHTEEQWFQKGSVYTELAKGNITQDQAKEQISGVPDASGNLWSPTGDNTNPVNIEDVDTDLDLDLMEDTTDTLEDVYEQPENIDVDIPVDNTPPVVEVEPDIPEPVITQPVEEEVKTEEEEEEKSEAPSSTTTSPPSPTTGTTGSVTVTETVPQKPNILIIQLEEAIEKLGKNDPELKEKLEKEKEKLITESAEGLPIEESEIILDDETKLIYDPYEGWIEVGIVIPWENESGEPVAPETEPVVAKPVEKPVEESKNGEGKTEDGTGTEDGTKDGTGDGTGDGLGEKGLFANLGGKGAKDPLGKFESVSIVDPVAPVSAADMYRRPQYITKSLFSEYFK